MATLQLLGRSLYSPQVTLGPGVSPLWQFFKSPPPQNSVLIFRNGQCTEQATFSTDDINDPEVHTFILGGTDYRCESGSFEHQSLLAAGYTFREVTPRDTYSADYTDDYP